MGGKVDDLLSVGLTLLDAESGASLGLLDTAADRGEGRPDGEAALPERLGRYLVLERLGAGGMGVVVAAYDPELDRKVAIKLIHAGREDEEARTRLLREAQAMARLAHPNVVAVHDVGVFAGQVFVAMEFVRGTTLGAWLQAGARGWSEVLAVFVSAGRGLAAAQRLRLDRPGVLRPLMLGSQPRLSLLLPGGSRGAKAPTRAGWWQGYHCPT